VSGGELSALGVLLVLAIVIPPAWCAVLLGLAFFGVAGWMHEAGGAPWGVGLMVVFALAAWYRAATFKGE